MSTLDLNQFTEKFNLPDQAIDINEIPWVPTHGEEDGVWFKPIRFDLTTGNWIHISKFAANCGNATHRHTGGTVLAYTLQGSWRYLEREWVAKPGTFVYEPPGDIHTLVVDGEEDMITLFYLGGVIEYFDEQGNVFKQDDIFYRMKKYYDYCEANNIPVKDLTF
ncbi:2,4'-dihydroxyacetophenone dioxygenase family protein [Halalkalibacter krulwichiae]|uniref:ChrR Cupin-like domain protein n=1 Tax=Halalkalibacter krulwichiae TaxID=199441 RepID=A0A1X9MG50_9BACI|nr:2,4'-dihydroxyacetophenone dioxygenase family protein [Halalkalibacter krulwichiae]ARK32437.1 ChrR Cupin-like domain protein [Halalkalibacter krulwichiae]